MPNLSAFQKMVLDGIKASGSRLPDRCLFCGSAKQEMELGAWLPDSKSAWDAVGYTRVIAYCVCPKCRELPDLEQEVRTHVMISRHRREMRIRVSPLHLVV
jgi:hypothetical protein